MRRDGAPANFGSVPISDPDQFDQPRSPTPLLAQPSAILPSRLGAACLGASPNVPLGNAPAA
jgi:hypothetical protein